MSEDVRPTVEPVVEDRVAEITALRARLLQAELRTEAVRAGMVDLDGVKLIDPTTVAVNDAGGSGRWGRGDGGVAGGEALAVRTKQQQRGARAAGGAAEGEKGDGHDLG